MNKVGDMTLEQARTILREHLKELQPLQLGPLYQIVAIQTILDYLDKQERM